MAGTMNITIQIYINTTCVILIWCFSHTIQNSNLSSKTSKSFILGLLVICAWIQIWWGWTGKVIVGTVELVEDLNWGGRGEEGRARGGVVWENRGERAEGSSFFFFTFHSPPPPPTTPATLHPSDALNDDLDATPINHHHATKERETLNWSCTRCHHQSQLRYSHAPHAARKKEKTVSWNFAQHAIWWSIAIENVK